MITKTSTVSDIVGHYHPVWSDTKNAPKDEVLVGYLKSSLMGFAALNPQPARGDSVVAPSIGMVNLLSRLIQISIVRYRTYWLKLRDVKEYEKYITPFIHRKVTNLRKKEPEGKLADDSIADLLHKIYERLEVENQQTQVLWSILNLIRVLELDPVAVLNDCLAIDSVTLLVKSKEQPTMTEAQVATGITIISPASKVGDEILTENIMRSRLADWAVSFESVRYASNTSEHEVRNTVSEFLSHMSADTITLMYHAPECHKAWEQLSATGQPDELTPNKLRQDVADWLLSLESAVSDTERVIPLAEDTLTALALMSDEAVNQLANLTQCVEFLRLRVDTTDTEPST